MSATSIIVWPGRFRYTSMQPNTKVAGPVGKFLVGRFSLPAAPLTRREIGVHIQWKIEISTHQSYLGAGIDQLNKWHDCMDVNGLFITSYAFLRAQQNLLQLRTEKVASESNPHAMWLTGRCTSCRKQCAWLSNSRSFTPYENPINFVGAF